MLALALDEDELVAVPVAPRHELINVSSIPCRLLIMEDGEDGVIHREARSTGESEDYTEERALAEVHAQSLPT